jgi:enolase-phosphatase E1
MRGILLDIEGTTTPITFVYDVLFPFVRRRLDAWLPQADVSGLQSEYQEDIRRGRNPPAWSVPPKAYVEWLMDQDRKSTALKKLQGEIWLQGYQKGELHGEVFPDVPPALARWQRKGIDVRIFSSGSILAQRLLFSSTRTGNLTQYLNGYFDTTTGPKNEPASYVAIGRAFGLAPSEVLFISDVARELDAGGAAGMRTMLCIRPGNHPQPPNDHRVIASFEEIQ